MIEGKEWFGRKAPLEAPCAWGARAIFQGDGRGGLQVDLVWDRQQAIGSEEGRERLKAALDNYLLPELRHRAGRELDTRSLDVLRIEAHGWVLEACPNASYGYLYICAYPAGAEVPPPVPRGKWKAPPASKTRIKSRPRSVGYGR